MKTAPDGSFRILENSIGTRPIEVGGICSAVMLFENILSEMRLKVTQSNLDRTTPELSVPEQ